MATGKEEKAETRTAGMSLTETGVKLGKALARSSFKVEDTSRRVRKVAGDLMGTVSRKKEKSPKASPFQPPAEMTVEAGLGFLAGDIYQYLQGTGPTPVDKLVRKLMQGRNTQAAIYAAIGWLAREGKITFSPDGSTLSPP